MENDFTFLNAIFHSNAIQSETIGQIGTNRVKIFFCVYEEIA